MHRTESTNATDTARYTNGPPATTVDSQEMNALQEELCYVIETLGITLNSRDTETYQQLYTALTSLAFLVALGINASPTEINTTCDGSTAKNSHTHTLADGGTDVTVTATIANSLFTGTLSEHRAKFMFKDTDAIYIYPGCYAHQGGSNQFVYWDSVLTYQFTGLGANDWYYLYIDDSAIIAAGTNLLTASEFIHSTTEPAWSDTKRGWYNGTDRCIFAVLTDGSSHILAFAHDGDLVQYAYVEDLANTTDVDIATDVTITIPKFTNKALAAFWGKDAGGGGTLFICWPKDIGGANPPTSICGKVETGVTESIVTMPFITNTSQVIQVLGGNNGTLGVFTCGWYFSVGM